MRNLYVEAACYGILQVCAVARKTPGLGKRRARCYLALAGHSSVVTSFLARRCAASWCELFFLEGSGFGCIHIGHADS